jgi:two-component system, NtrC family, sensor kinase
MKKGILTVFCCFSICVAGAQELDADSLRYLLSITKQDTARVILLSDLSRQLQRSNPDSAFLLGEQGLSLAKKMGYEKGLLFCSSALSGTWWSVGDYATAIRLMLPYVSIAEKSGNPEWKTRVYIDLYNAYRDQGDFSEALTYAYKIVPLAESFNHCQFCNVTKAAIAVIYLEKHQLDSAQAYIQKALDAPASFADGWVYSVAGRIVTALSEYDKAFGYYRQSIPYLQNINNLKDLAGTCNNMAALFLQIGKNDSALVYARRALMVAQPKQFSKEKMEASLILSKLFEPLNIDSAFWYHKVAMAAKDSLYNLEKQRQLLSSRFNEELKQQELAATQQQYKNKIRTNALAGSLFTVLAVAFVLYRSNKNKQKANKKINEAYTKLKATQAQLIQSEKMASLGELTAGIAHEIQNPLNFVNNFSETNVELIEEAQGELDTGNPENAAALLSDVKENESKINYHGKRADAIVKGMLQHSQKNSGQKEPTDINALADEYLRLSYHGFRAKDKTFNATIKTDFDNSIAKINVMPQEIGRVLLNLFNNAFYATHEQLKKLGAGYEPTVSVSTKKMKDNIEIRVQDNGIGISKSVQDKIFQPFFTTKPAGEGTGLGLSLSYDIIKAHGGELKVESKEGQRTQFIVQLPLAQ